MHVAATGSVQLPQQALACARERCCRRVRATRCATPASVTPPPHTSRRRRFFSLLRAQEAKQASRSKQHASGSRCLEWPRRGAWQGLASVLCRALANVLTTGLGAAAAAWALRCAPEAGAAGVADARPKQVQALQARQLRHADHARICAKQMQQAQPSQ